jgi:hypothetical protein
VTRNFESYTVCSPDNGGKASFMVPTGWRRTLTVDLPQGVDKTTGAPKPPLPFATILQRIDTKQLVVIVRGTLTTPEWLIGMCESPRSNQLHQRALMHTCCTISFF